METPDAWILVVGFGLTALLVALNAGCIWCLIEEAKQNESKGRKQ